MKKFIKLIFSSVLALSVAVFSGVVYYDATLSDSYYVAKGTSLTLSGNSVLQCKPNGSSLTVGKSNSASVGAHETTVSLFGLFPIKTVSVTETEETEVVVLGTPFGLKIFTEGVLVVGYSDVDTENGTKNPALEAGVKTGDIILKINGEDVTENSDVQSIITKSQGKPCELELKRDGNTFSVTLTPVLSVTDKVYKMGLWVRDSSAGIGTLTFYSPTLKVAAGLGHGICDTDTGELIPFDSGQFVKAEIVGIKKSSGKVTGELQGVFSGGDIAQLAGNEITGVYGCDCSEITDGESAMPIALKQEVKTGKACILTTVDDNEPCLYECEIEKVYHNDSAKIKNMVIKITDEELLAKTGGIVQGMSGSPIIQNGKLVGAVTHVFVNDPTRGYGIFAENMLETAQNISKDNLKNAS